VAFVYVRIMYYTKLW